MAVCYYTLLRVISGMKITKKKIAVILAIVALSASLVFVFGYGKEEISEKIADKVTEKATEAIVDKVVDNAADKAKEKLTDEISKILK
jgi:sensor domain CHASE-containing protein